ncbi:MAG: DUF2892 domain-containing protein [Pseudomonadota bacterium]
MMQNVGTIDRAIRALAGLGLVGLFLIGTVTGTLGWLALLVGVVLLGTAAMGWCPPYALLGIRTCAVKKA